MSVSGGAARTSDAARVRTACADGHDAVAAPGNHKEGRDRLGRVHTAATFKLETHMKQGAVAGAPAHLDAHDARILSVFSVEKAGKPPSWGQQSVNHKMADLSVLPWPSRPRPPQPQENIWLASARKRTAAMRIKRTSGSQTYTQVCHTR